MGPNDVHATPVLPPRLAFGEYRLDSVRLELRHQDRLLPLRPKVFALLCYLLAHPGRAIGKSELMACLWPDVVVTEDSLVQCVAELRAALGPDGARFLVTVPRHGYRFEGVPQALPAPEPPAVSEVPVVPPATTGVRAGRRPLALGGTALVVCAIALAALLWPRAAVDADLAFRRERSLAVLPLMPRGPQSTREFADAMTDDLIGDIARLPGTTVIARASAATAAAQEQDLRRVGQLLDVAYVATGTVSRDDGAVEVDLQFVSTSSGAVLWTERWRQPDAEAASRRSDIPRRIARALDLQLTSAAYRATSSSARSPAIAALARGDHLIRSSTAPGNARKAREAYEEALAVDPGSARAWTGLALSHLSDIQTRQTTDPARQAALAAEALQRAMAIDPDYSVAHYAMGHLRIVQEDPMGALASYERALALNPSDAWTHTRMAQTLLALGRFDEVAAAVERGRRLSPLEITNVSFGRAVAGAALFHKGQDDAAYAQFQAATLANPSNATAWALVAALDALHGRTEAAAQAMARLKALRPNATVSLFRRTLTGNGPALKAGNERYLDGLAKAGLPP